MEKKGKSFCLVCESVTQYIDRRHQYLGKTPETDIYLSSRRKNKLAEEVNRHSVSIEFLNKGKTKEDARKIKKAKRDSYKDINLAYKWAYENYNGELTPEYIKEVGGKIEPSIINGFRNSKIRVLDSLTSPPAPEKIQREFNIFLWEYSGLSNPLEKAIHAHFNIARIHPFFDGNGRTSRIVQNVILRDVDLPLPTIALKDRREYVDLIREATYEHSMMRGTSYTLQNKIKELNRLADMTKLTNPELSKGKTFARDILINCFGEKQKAFYDYLAFKTLESFKKEVDR
jgi:Fic family protein